MASIAKRPGWSIVEHARRYPVLSLALVAICAPTLFAIASQSWSTEAGVHGPLVLATALWLIWRRWGEIVADARPGNLAVGVALLATTAVIYAFGRALGFLSVEVAALMLAILALFYCFVGHRLLMRLWFPIVYMAFVIPLPGWFVDGITQPLKFFVSQVVTHLLSLAGYPIVREGVTLYIAQYQLLVEDACAGLNSIISLTAIGLFYIYLLYNASWRYAMVLMLFVIPVAVVANVIRVIGLVLITYYFGDAAAQGYLHNFAGIVTFVSALLTIFAVDIVLSPLRRWLGGRSDDRTA